MKARIFAVLIMFLAGIWATVSVISGEKAIQDAYAGYLEAARSNAEKGVPFVSARNYQRAFEVLNEDESIYKEYLTQAELLGGDFYTEAVKDYVLYFPESPDAYECLVEYYYEAENYQKLMDMALEARSKGIATDIVRDRYMECSVMYKVQAGGFSEAGSFVGEVAKVKAEGLYGYINSQGIYTILPQYEDASFFLQANAAVKRDGQWFMIDDGGNKVAVTSQKVDYMSVLNNNWVLFSLDGKYDYMSSGLVVPEKLRFEDASIFRNEVAAVKQNGKWALINSSMEMITDFIFEDVVRDEYNACINNGVIFVKKNGKYYMCGANGAKLSETAFDDVYPFVANEPAAVCIDGKWGYVDSTGNMVIEPQYENAKSFSIGMGAVCKDGLWGYINASNEVRMEYQFVDCIPFSLNGMTAICEEDGTWTYIKLLAYM